MQKSTLEAHQGSAFMQIKKAEESQNEQAGIFGFNLPDQKEEQAFNQQARRDSGSDIEKAPL